MASSRTGWVSVSFDLLSKLTPGKTLSTLALVLATMDEEPSEFYSDTTLVGELHYSPCD